jgi:hypothetical protein
VTFVVKLPLFLSPLTPSLSHAGERGCFGKNIKAFIGAKRHLEGLLRKPLFLPCLHTPLEAAGGDPLAEG